MLPYLLILTIINLVFAYEPSCTSCKWFVPNSLGYNDMGLCKMFKNTCVNKNGKENIILNFATHCRNDEKLCGSSGFLYESKNDKSNESNSEIEILNEFDELNNRCCGEVNEKDEIEQLERDFFEIFQRIQRYNKKRFFNL